MRCTIVMEQNAGESALYDSDGRKIWEGTETLTNWDALDHGCTVVESRFAALDERCQIYRCTSYTRGLEPDDYDCETVWPEQLDEGWLQEEEPR